MKGCVLGGVELKAALKLSNPAYMKTKGDCLVKALKFKHLMCTSYNKDIHRLVELAKFLCMYRLILTLIAGCENGYSIHRRL